MKQVFISIFSISILLLGCKSTKTSKSPGLPPMAAFKMAVNYSIDSVLVKPKPIQVDGDGFGAQDSTVDFNVFSSENNDSLLILNVSSYTGCKQMDFELYQNPVVIKTLPPRYRLRLSKAGQSGCGELKPVIYTVAFDIRPILSEYTEAYFMIEGVERPIIVKKQMAK